ELQGKVLCGGHFLIWQNLPEPAQDWFEVTVFWVFFTDVCDSEGGSFGSPGKERTKGFPRKTMFDTLILPEMYLVKCVSRVWNLKLQIGGNLNPLNVEDPADAQHNITVYELWGNEDSN
ncbi:hypothetical protein FD755_025425, partial [Muntiacus reevesi]